MPKKKISKNMILGIILIAFSIYGIIKLFANIPSDFMFVGSFGFMALVSFGIVFILGLGILFDKIRIVI